MRDVPVIRELINHYSQKGDMLPKGLLEIYEGLRDFFVYVNGDEEILGCCALHLYWNDLAEIQSLAVLEPNKGRGIGMTLVRTCIEEARQLGISRVFTLTSKPGFFEKHGFERIDRSELPHKVWAACVKCVKFPDCDEVALLHVLD